MIEAANSFLKWARGDIFDITAVTLLVFRKNIDIFRDIRLYIIMRSKIPYLTKNISKKEEDENKEEENKEEEESEEEKPFQKRQLYQKYHHVPILRKN